VSHMVIFRGQDGQAAYHPAGALDEAIRFVEHLRNEEQVNDARIFALAEVPIEFKVHWRVEVTTPAVPAPPVSVAPAAEPDPESGPFAPDDVPAATAAAEDTTAADEPTSDDRVAGVPDADPVPVSAGMMGSSGGPAAAASSRFGLFSRG
jgi:hypothetical protein